MLENRKEESIKVMKKILLGLCFLNIFYLPEGFAEPVKASYAELELLSELDSIVPGESMEVLVRIKMDPGWHIYWKNPGDSGFPPKIDWELPEGFKPGKIYWPYPKRIIEDPFTTYGYEGEIFLWSEIVASRNPSNPILKAQVEYLICKDICVPGKADLHLDLPVDEKRREGRSRQSPGTSTSGRGPRPG